MGASVGLPLHVLVLVAASIIDWPDDRVSELLFALSSRALDPIARRADPVRVPETSATTGFDVALLVVSSKCADAPVRQVSALLPTVVVATPASGVDLNWALDAGADEFVAHANDAAEISERLRGAYHRRPLNVVVCGDGELVIDPNAMSVTHRGRPVLLTAAEARYIFVLALHAGQWVKNEDMLVLVFGTPNADDSKVRVHRHRIRRKLGEAGRYIEAKPGYGVRLVVQAN